MRKAVVRTDQSPLNALRWCIELECGHEVWVTQQRRPTIRSMVCPACAKHDALKEKKR